jgi:hypothetical protein
MRTSLILLSFFILSLLLFGQCKKKEPTVDDKTLFSKAMSTGFTYYKNDSSYLATTPASGHSPAYFRVRFNAIAQAALTDSGKLPISSSFPEGSMIVKELYDAPGGDIVLVAIMQKATGNSAAGANWLWGEYYGNGSLGISVSRKGDQCTNCHSQSGNRDYTRTFAFYP